MVEVQQETVCTEFLFKSEVNLKLILQHLFHHHLGKTSSHYWPGSGFAILQKHHGETGKGLGFYDHYN